MLALLAAARANAGSTDPMLMIGQATTTGVPARIVELVGAWGFDDALQLGYPLNVVVHQGSTFVRYPVGGPPVSGSSAALADGLAAGEIANLEATGTAEPLAKMERFAAHEMTLSLPPLFSSDPVEVVLYVTLPGEGTFLSNAAASRGGGS